MPTSHRSILTCYAQTSLPTEWGIFETRVYRNQMGEEHMAIYQGNLTEAQHEPILVRIHSACFTGEALGSLKCDCKAQLERAFQEINILGKGVVVYLFQEGRGIGLGNKMRAYALQAQGVDTVDANRQLGFEDDAREYHEAIEILKDLGVKRLKIMTNNPLKINALTQAGFDVERVSIEVGRNEVNASYLDTKRNRMSHLLKES